MKNKEEKTMLLSSGRGPAECAWVVAQLLKVVIEALKKTKLDFEIVNKVTGIEPRTLNSVNLLVFGPGSASFIKDWLGTIQWIGKSPYRKFHKRKNWFVGIYEMEAKPPENGNEDQVKFQTYRGSGPGGQAVNKLETAVRAIHVPSGLSATAQDSRSQLENKKMAVKRLHENLKKQHIEFLSKRAEKNWEAHLSLERGNPKRIYEGEKFRLKQLN